MAIFFLNSNVFFGIRFESHHYRATRYGPYLVMDLLGEIAYVSYANMRHENDVMHIDDSFFKRYFWKFLEIFRKKKEYDGLVVECEVWFRLDVILGLILPFGVSSKQTQSSPTYANNFKLRPNIYNNSNHTNSIPGWD